MWLPRGAEDAPLSWPGRSCFPQREPGGTSLGEALQTRVRLAGAPYRRTSALSAAGASAPPPGVSFPSLVPRFLTHFSKNSILVKTEHEGMNRICRRITKCDVKTSRCGRWDRQSPCSVRPFPIGRAPFWPAARAVT